MMTKVDQSSHGSSAVSLTGPRPSGGPVTNARSRDAVRSGVVVMPVWLHDACAVQVNGGLDVQTLAFHAVANAALTAALLSVVFGVVAWRVALALRPIAALRASLVLLGAAVAVWTMSPAVFRTPLALAAVLPPSVLFGHVLALLSVPLFMSAVILGAFSLGREPREGNTPRNRLRAGRRGPSIESSVEA